MESLFNISAEINSNGQMTYDENQLIHAVKKLKKPETRKVRIVIIDDYKDMTLKQLKYYHGFLLTDVCHAYENVGEKMNKIQACKSMRELFLFNYMTQLRSGRSSKVLISLDTQSPYFPSTKVISKFFEDIVQYCATNMNYVIQLPDDIKDNNLNFNR